MFTGIIQAIGEIKSIEKRGQDFRLSIASEGLNLAQLKEGDSVAINGVCLTIVEKSLPSQHAGMAGQAGIFSADVSLETLRCTNFAELKAGQMVNLEPALTPNQSMGGHWVSGHVDCLGEIIETNVSGRSKVFRIDVPTEYAKYIVAKGSVTLDGVSLTVNTVSGNTFAVNIIPHTVEVTTLKAWKPGSKLNVEVDIIARYLERLLSCGATYGGQESGGQTKGGVSVSSLTKAGFYSSGDHSGK